MSGLTLCCCFCEIQVLVQSAKGKTRVAAAQTRESENVHLGGRSISATRKSTSSLETNHLRHSSATAMAVHSNENAPPMRVEVDLPVKEEKIVQTVVVPSSSERSEGSQGSISTNLEPGANVNSATIASLERRTNQNLYISRESKARARPGEDS